MASEASEFPQDSAHIAIVDVDASTDASPEVNSSVREISCDSGHKINSCSLTDAILSIDSTIEPSKCEGNDLKVDISMASEGALSVKTASASDSSVSSPRDSMDNITNAAELSVTHQDEPVKVNSNDELKILHQNGAEPLSKNGSSTDLVTNQICEGVSNDAVDEPEKYFDANKSLATSSVSLNEPLNTNVGMCKSPHSRSAENISTELKTDQENIDKDAILSQFTSQKSKVGATHIIAPEAQASQDARYARIPKELLSQDLGSIVKNVHGIFSSVSGSLKSAYTYRAGQMPYMKPVKPVPNGKVMNDIFEDEQNEDKVSSSVETINHELHSNETAMTSEQVNNVDDVLNGDSLPDAMQLQIESLERVLGEQRKENTALRERIKQQTEELQAKDFSINDLEAKLALMAKRVENAIRTKDTAVMRYASVECTAIEARRAADAAARAERAALAEADLLNTKIKAAREDKQRICQIYDDKCHELQNTERELSKVRDELKEVEGRLKWTQSKLRMEIDAYKDSAERVEKLQAQVSELEAARDVAAANSADLQRAKQLEVELQESQAALILCRHEKEELERRYAECSEKLEMRQHMLEGARGDYATVYKEMRRLERTNMRLEEEAAEHAMLRVQAALSDSLGAQLLSPQALYERWMMGAPLDDEPTETERAEQAEAALVRERARADTCARREASALEHSASLTARHVAESARAAHSDAQAQALSADNVELRARVEALELEGRRLAAALAEQADRRQAESRVLARKVAELQEEVSNLNQQLEWEKGENGVLKKKHANAIKELNRELQRSLKRCEQLEARLPPDPPATRTGSVTSLSSGESAPAEDAASGQAGAVPDIQVREPDRQALVERVVALQRAAARRAERCEFLEEHARQLTDELRAKSRLLRHLLPTLPAQALSTIASDSNKKEIARHGGGAMAALWGGDPGGLTLELSLEMNKRLQAVLEDTLLKNITLKENMDTLGEEIATLKGQRNFSPETK